MIDGELMDGAFLFDHNQKGIRINDPMIGSLAPSDKAMVWSNGEDISAGL